MKASIISIGDELLFGQTLDTNAHWISQKLSQLGIDVFQRFTIHDLADEIKNTLDKALDNTDLVIISGGLGPTQDDKTKSTLAGYFNVKLVLNEEVLRHINKLFSGHKAGDLERNKQQAMLPGNCTVIPNDLGTAPGMWFDIEHQCVVSVPGVPIEMKGMMNNTILPRIKTHFALPVLIHFYLMTAAVGESQIAEMLQDFEKSLPGYIKLAYLPGQGMVKLRLTAKGEHKIPLLHAVLPYFERMKSMLGHIVYSENQDDRLEHVIIRKLKKSGNSLATAESCTGGTIAKKITSVPGSSAVFKGSIVAYANEIKIALLGVPELLLKTKGAVSKEVVIAMAKGIIRQMHSDFAIAVTGIAGPGGGSKKKPVGTVWIAVANKQEVHSKQLSLPGKRTQIIEWTSVIALEMLRRFFMKHFV